jgi:oligoendopeptidase F
MTEGDEASRTATVTSYLELLRSGGNDHPVTLLKKAGIDLATTEPTEALVAEMDELVDRLEEELAKLDS